MQHKLSEGALLDEKGHLNEAGYAFKAVRQYDRKAIKAGKLRIKEWDYYIVTNGKIAVALTVADNSYMSLASASFLDFCKPSYKTTSEMKFFTLGKLGMPSSPEEGDVLYNSGRAQIHFIKQKNKRRLVCRFEKFEGEKTLEANITLSGFPKEDMVIATPFKEDKKAFYYNSKVNCMTAEGYVSFGGEIYEFDKSDSLGTLDWGRGVWTYKNTWYWGSLSTYVEGRKVGFNIGYGFGDTGAASENMIFAGGKAYKTEDVTFNIPKKDGKDDFMSPWTFTSGDGRINLDFTPIIDRRDFTNVLVICSDQHQVFGKFSGTLALPDGEIIALKDALGFAEKVYNKW